MDYEQIYMEMLDELRKVWYRNVDICQYVFHNSDPGKLTPLPEYVRKALFAEYISFLTEAHEDGGAFPDYLNNPDDEGVKVLGASSVPLWDTIRTGVSSVRVTDEEELDIAKLNENMGNAIITVVPMLNGKMAYLLTAHRNVSSMLIGKMIFVEGKWIFGAKKPSKLPIDGPSYAEGDFLTLSYQLDAVIYDGNCFILNASNFNRIFKYDEIQTKELDKNAAQITGLKFLSDGSELLNMVKKSRRLKTELLKAIANGRLERFQNTTPQQVKESIERYEELAIEFDEQSRIKIDKKTYKNVVGILSDRIHIDLIFNTLNGVDQDE